MGIMDRRQDLLAAAVEVFAKYGFLGATTRRIAEAAGVNEVTLFRYFGSKETLLLEAMQHDTQSSGIIELPATPVDPIQELSLWSEVFIQHLRLRSSIIRKTMSEIEEHPEIGNCASHVPRRASAGLCTYLDALKREGFTTEEFDSKTASAMLMGAIFGDAMGRGMMSDIYPEPADKAASKYAEFLLRAVGVEESGGRKNGAKRSR